MKFFPAPVLLVVLVFAAGCISTTQTSAQEGQINTNWEKPGRMEIMLEADENGFYREGEKITSMGLGKGRHTFIISMKSGGLGVADKCEFKETQTSPSVFLGVDLQKQCPLAVVDGKGNVLSELLLTVK